MGRARSLAAGESFAACLGAVLRRLRLAVPGRLIRSWSRRTEAPKASATGRDRNPIRYGPATGRQMTDNSGRAST